MYRSIEFVFFALCVLRIHAKEEIDQPNNFTAVVHEYCPVTSLERNTYHYELIIWDTAKNFRGDIVVFPERTLILNPKDAVFVPDPEDKVIPYKNGTYDENDAMFKISEAAAKYMVYTVINLFEKVKCTNTSNCPDRGYFLYDTNVAFDRQGMVIARYRKYNVYSGNQVDKPEKPDLSTFTTDFNVTFGMFTGFDILFKTPAIDLIEQKNVKNFVYPSRWPGELPFLTAPQVQDGWSYAMNVNVFASGANDVKNGCSGTGIYVARQKKISSMYDESGSSLMFLAVPRKTVETSFAPDKPKIGSLNLLEDPSIPSSQGKDLDVNKGEFSESVCHAGLCCNFNVKYKKLPASDGGRHKYRAVAFQGVRRFGANMMHEVAYCAVVLCTDGNCAKKPEDGDYPLQFEDIKITANFNKRNTLQFPSTLLWTNDPYQLKNFATMPYNTFGFERKEVTGTVMANVTMNLKSGGLKNLITFGIFGRKFD